jgi:hypothetical protein
MHVNVIVVGITFSERIGGVTYVPPLVYTLLLNCMNLLRRYDEIVPNLINRSRQKDTSSRLGPVTSLFFQYMMLRRVCPFLLGHGHLWVRMRGPKLLQ